MADQVCQDWIDFSLTWKKGDQEWQRGPAKRNLSEEEKSLFLSGGSRIRESEYDVFLIYANRYEIRKCQKCRGYLGRVYGVPDLCFADFCGNSNGYFGSDDTVDGDGNVDGVSSWFGAHVKDVYDRPNATDGLKQYEWYHLNVFVRWSYSTQQTLILIFNRRPSIMERLPFLLLERLNLSGFSDPYWPYVSVMEEIVRLQDRSVYSIRGMVRNAECTRVTPQQPEPDYTRLHELARHSIHVQETLDVAIMTMNSILAEHENIMTNILNTNGSSKAIYKRNHKRLLFFGQLLFDLHARSASNKERLQNEIGLAFNTVAQIDSGISVQINRAAQSDSAAMRTIAFVTLLFLPATFIAALFSMSFFNHDKGSGSWTVSKQFWIYWAITIPVTVFTPLIWYNGTKLFPRRSQRKDPV